MAKGNPFSCTNPVLGQLLSFIPNEIFKKCVSESESDKWYKKLKTWNHFVFMFYAILTGGSSLREVVKNFTLMGNKLQHLGLLSIPKRSSVSDANAKRNSKVYGLLYFNLYLYYQSYLSDSYVSSQIKINDEISPQNVEIFDSTTITLFTDIFKGCGRMPKNGQRKGGIKAFTKITLSERVPNFVCLKSAATNEKVFLGELALEKGTIAVFDKGFHKYVQYHKWGKEGVFYVTRLNDNANFKVIEQYSLEQSEAYGVHQDSKIELSYICKDTSKEITFEARMVAYIEPVTQRKFVFLTNMMDVSAFTICMLYKDRWTIEPLFKQIKQNFELTYFLSDSAEGIKTQIWVALILNLIFTVIHKMTKEAEDFATMVKLAAKNTTVYVDLVSFLKNSTLAIRYAEREIIEKIQLDLFNKTQGASILPPAENSS